jgi:acyl-CoA synthetase
VPVAFVVLDGTKQASVEELTGHLHETGLARQKTPVDWHFLDALPMTPSGKVKKFELVRTTEGRG